MIEFVEGRLTSKSPSSAVVQVGGLGLRAIISLNTYDDLPAPGEEVRLWTYFQIRDEEPVLFGFSTREERWLFENLISVNGVGPRLATTILSGAKSEVIRKALEQTRWNRKKASEVLDISYKALLYKMKEYRIDIAAKLALILNLAISILD